MSFPRKIINHPPGIQTKHDLLTDQYVTANATQSKNIDISGKTHTKPAP